ncbi:hypothetical protein Y032_0002g511 [Ancylostoma ceylanicum]|uniref:Uncharacterized protein n=1 Tax=Ancylostoma ceylanicum TaxID=53326 RepID=A0A016W1N0_9BILA|nr:hypothetical protein Y032_0002g511 [Ancylostoma ceylanicum]
MVLEAYHVIRGNLLEKDGAQRGFENYSNIRIFEHFHECIRFGHKYNRQCTLGDADSQSWFATLPLTGYSFMNPSPVHVHKIS